MRICSLEELSKKEVISCMDCSRLGFIVDVNFQLENAQIVSVVVEEQSGCLSLKKNSITIPWECIKKIGDDLIIADFIKPPVIQNQQPKQSFLSKLFKN